MNGIENALAALHDLGGYFVFEDEHGEEFVLVRKQDFEVDEGNYYEERQLELPAAPKRDDLAADQVLDRINREIAAYHMQDEEERIDDLALDTSSHEDEEEVFRRSQNGVPEPKRVRFEPLRGDLSPDLQE